MSRLNEDAVGVDIMPSTLRRHLADAPSCCSLQPLLLVYKTSSNHQTFHRSQFRIDFL